MNILSIGNSFSQDAQRYLSRIAKSEGISMNTFNLYIGGCPLAKHFQNMNLDARAYTLEMNGESTGFYVSIKEALLNREWDIVTLQQVSHESPDYDTYQPYLDKLAECVRMYAPKAKIAIHQTWGYEDGSERLASMGYNSHADMVADIEVAYNHAMASIKADYLIPSGALIAKLVGYGVEKVHRDTFHLSLGLGRYAVALLWLRVLTGRNVEFNNFCDFDEDVSFEQSELVKRCVMEMTGR
ncbi:MAG: DUF4886 domain-containing protein [Eubacteriales bacterium]|nr:DUF4886 domain-containing protein [Eubacteriales bacterium]